MCTLLPEKPNALSAARRTDPGPRGSHARSAVLTTKGEASNSQAGLGVAKFSEGGICRCASARRTLTSPTAPAALIVWPTAVFTEPRAQKPRSPVLRRKARVSPSTSMGSPSRVPVPCASTKPMVAGSTPNRSYTDARSAAWEGALGAVMPLVRPSWLASDPSITPQTWSPSARARASGFITTDATASPGTKPSAAASKARQTPDGESMPARLAASTKVGVGSTQTPPAIAMSQRPSARLSRARWIAVSEEEHAVSTVRQGPRRSSR